MPTEKSTTKPGGTGRKPEDTGHGASNVPARRDTHRMDGMQLMEAVVERENMWRAYDRVVSNKGAAGIDGMRVEALRPYLKEAWPAIKEALLNERYEPQSVRKVEIPKPGGGVRTLGIPTVKDRLVQQALLQTLTPIFDPEFSGYSYGFRPGRSAHMAVRQAHRYVSEGRRWVVDLDLEKFFDRVNHDILMSRVARRVKDKRVLRVVRKFLQAGIMDGGVSLARREGTPQGGPLSPLLSNILLDDLDKELERRGHAFVRYADDCNVYVASKAAAERVMESVTQFLTKKLKLKVNRDKSAADRPWKRTFLGYSMTMHRAPRLKAGDKAVARLKDKLRDMFRQARGRNLAGFIEKDLKPVLRGWANYFHLAQVKGTFEDLDQWIRRRLRLILWRQWKRPRTRARNLEKLGIEKVRAWTSAFNGHGPWWNSGASHMNHALPLRYFDNLGLVSLLKQVHFAQSAPRTAGYGTVRPVV